MIQPTSSPVNDDRSEGQGPNGVFVSMPSKRKKNGEFKDIAHLLNRETRERMERRILSEYERVRAETPPVRVEEAPVGSDGGDRGARSGGIEIGPKPQVDGPRGATENLERSSGNRPDYNHHEVGRKAERIELLRIARCLLTALVLAVLPSWASAGTATHLILNNDPCTVGPCPALAPTPVPVARAGEEFGLYVAALDDHNARDSGYTGTVTFSSSDPAATLPPAYTFTPLDRGVKSFTAILRTLGQQTITVTDVSGAVLPGTFALTVTGSGQPSVDVPALTPMMQILLALLLVCAGVWLFRTAR